MDDLYDETGMAVIISRMRTLLLLSIFAGLISVPFIASATGIEYSFVTEKSDTEALIKKITLTSEEWFRCVIQTGDCSAAPQGTTVVAPGTNTTPAFMLAYRKILPGGATRLTRSPDGRYIAFYIPGTQTRGKRTFGVMDTTNLSMYTKDESIAYWDLLTEGIRVFAFSPDSKSLIYIDDIKNHPTLYKVDLSKLSTQNSTLSSTRMFSREYSIADVQFKDDDSILFIANREGPYQWSLYEYSLTSFALKKIIDNVSYDVNLSRTGNILFFGVADENGVRPILYDLTTSKTRSLSLPVSGSLPTRGKVVTKLKGNLSGVFLLEKSGNSDTLLVWLHGGPYRQAALGYHPYTSYGGYDWILETARQSDVGVLKLDYPGSAGFGRVFAESISGHVGVKDATDAAAAISDFAKRNSYKNVYLMGNSYGGYLALKLLVNKPTVYKGAMSIAGVADWTTMLTALDTSIFNLQFGGTAGNDNFDEYARASIYNHVNKLSGQKIVLVHGDKDSTIPIKQSAGLATFLEQNGKPAKLITLSGENHVFKKPESFETVCNATLEFVGKTGGAPCKP